MKRTHGKNNIGEIVFVMLLVTGLVWFCAVWHSVAGGVF